MTQQVLIISDDGPNESLRQALCAKGFAVTIAEDAEQGYDQMVDKQFDLAVVSLDRAITGAGLIKRIRSNSRLRHLKVLTIAEWGTGQAIMSLSLGADGFEPKPVDSRRLADAVENLLRPAVAMTASVSTNGESKKI